MEKENIINLTSFLDCQYQKIPLLQRMWHITHNILNVILCNICNKNPAKWNSGHEYGCCSKECSKEKMKRTNIERYGVDNPSKNKSSREKMKRTNIERYGVEIFSKSQEFREKSKQTNIERYGVDNYAKTEKFKMLSVDVNNNRDNQKIKEKSKQTNIERYGVDNYAKSDKSRKESREKSKEIFMNSLSKEYKLIKYGTPIYTLKHITCGKKFDIDYKLLCSRKTISKTELCLHCNPINRNISKGEKEVFDFIKSKYPNVISNDRVVIKPKEIDIYLPELQMGFEFNETNYHADPRIYEADEYVPRIHKLAREQWDRDNLKIKLCKEKGIELIIIWQIDWYKNKELEKDKIKKKIAERSCAI